MGAQDLSSGLDEASFVILEFSVSTFFEGFFVYHYCCCIISSTPDACVEWEIALFFKKRKNIRESRPSRLIYSGREGRL